MNVLSAPFLYVLPSQIEAFACFVNFIERCLPLYVRPTLTGVHRGLEVSPLAVISHARKAGPGCRKKLTRGTSPTTTRHQLLDRCFEAVDPELSEHLKRKGLSAELYAFPCELPLKGSGATSN